MIKKFNEFEKLKENKNSENICIDETILDCILAIINPTVANKSDLYYTDVEAREYLYDFFKNEAKGWYSDDFIEEIFMPIQTSEQEYPSLTYTKPSDE